MQQINFTKNDDKAVQFCKVPSHPLYTFLPKKDGDSVLRRSAVDVARWNEKIVTFPGGQRRAVGQYLQKEKAFWRLSLAEDLSSVRILDTYPRRQAGFSEPSRADTGKNGPVLATIKHAVHLYGSKKFWSRDHFQDGYICFTSPEDEQLFLPDGQPNAAFDQLMVALLLFAAEAYKKMRAAQAGLRASGGAGAY